MRLVISSVLQVTEEVFFTVPKSRSWTTEVKFVARHNYLVATSDQATMYFSRWPWIYIYLLHWPYVLLFLLLYKSRFTIYICIILTLTFEPGFIWTKESHLTFCRQTSLEVRHEISLPNSQRTSSSLHRSESESCIQKYLVLWESHEARKYTLSRNSKVISVAAGDAYSYQWALDFRLHFRRGRRGRGCLRHWATSISDGVTVLLIDIILPAALWPWSRLTL
jgi:hypothetical protein